MTNEQIEKGVKLKQQIQDLEYLKSLLSMTEEKKFDRVMRIEFRGRPNANEQQSGVWSSVSQDGISAIIGLRALDMALDVARLILLNATNEQLEIAKAELASL